MPPRKIESGRQPWQQRHTVRALLPILAVAPIVLPLSAEPLKPRAQDTLIRGIIDLVSTHRKELYKFPGLLGEVDDHGSDRIKKKVEQLMRGLGGGAGLGTGSGSGKGIIGAGTQEGGGERKRRKAEVAEVRADDGMSESQT